jgi:hypothetical protein
MQRLLAKSKLQTEPWKLGREIFSRLCSPSYLQRHLQRHLQRLAGVVDRAKRDRMADPFLGEVSHH